MMIPNCDCWEWREWEEYPIGNTGGSLPFSGWFKGDEPWEPDQYNFCYHCGERAKEKQDGQD